MKEYKRTCKACNSIWHFTEQDVKLEEAKRKKNIAKAAMGAVGNHLVGNMPLDQMEDLKRCNKCGSRNVIIVDVNEELAKEKESQRKKELEEEKRKNAEYARRSQVPTSRRKSEKSSSLLDVFSALFKGD